MMRWKRSLGLIVCLGLASGMLSTQAQVRPEGRELSNFDSRPGLLPQVLRESAEQQQAANLAKQRDPSLRVDFDELLGTPKFVHSRDGFLTGPRGEGRTIGAVTARLVPVTDPHRPVKNFLNEHTGLFGHGADVLAGARTNREFVGAHNGMRTVVWQQQVDDIPVFEAVLIAHTTRNGELVNVSSRFLPDARGAADAGMPNRASVQAAPPISAQQAVALAAGNVNQNVEATEVSAVDPLPTGAEKRQRFRATALLGDTDARLVWLPMERARMRLCWEVILTSRARGEMFRVLIDAQTGEALVRHCLTEYISDATYRVFTSDSPSPFSPGCSTPCTTQPALVSRSLVVTSAVSTVASPNGWINDGNNTTLGNNVDAHLDKNADNVPDTGSRPTGSPFRVFDFPMDLTQAPITYTNAAVVQLFYWNNWMHDKLYQLGFTEAAGNFQTDNFGSGGLGNDAVQADAQDGSDVNNANFSTPPDGSPGRMQMFLFNGPTPDRDGDFDAEVVLHEYTHGLSNRRVGGGVGISVLQTGGMGEGWSDFYGLALLSEPGDDINGNYAAVGYLTYQLAGLTQNYYFGIRRYPYSTDMTKNPLTFKDIDPSQASSHPGIPMSPIGGGPANEVHNMGEVWCVTLWEARAKLITKYGYAVGNQLILQLVTDGMNLSPANPNFLQARDAIIQADQVYTGGANRNELWSAFAKRGMGFSATSPSSSTTTGLVEAYDLPDSLKVTPATGLNSNGGIGGPFSPASQTYTMSNTGTNTLNWTAGKTAAWLDISSTTGSLGPGESNTVVITINATANSLSAGAYSDTVTFSNAVSGTTQSRTVTLTINPPTVFLADFEDGSGGYSADGFTYTPDPDATSNLWHGTTRRSVSPPHSQYYGLESTGNYNTGARTAGNLLSPSISLVGITSPIILSYKYFMQTENSPSWDIATVQISTNAGNTWITLATLTDSASFTTVSSDISAYAGKNLQIRFNFDTLDGVLNAFEGWYIDDVMITGTPAMPIITIPNAATEGDGVLAGQGVVSVTLAPTNNLTVTLSSSDTSEATVPPTVIILSGQTNATFDVTIIDDAVLDGDQSATITAAAVGYANANGAIVVHDNETATLTVTVPPTATEGQGVLANAGTVTVSAPVAANVTVSLASSDTTEVLVPPTVTILTGQTAAVFNITIVDDNQIDGSQTGTITAHVAGWTDGNATITVLDNENTNLTVKLPAFFREGQGATSNGCTVGISGTLASALTVSLNSSDTTELTVPSSVMIPAGQTSVVFTATVVDDSETDGAQAVTVTAGAPGFANGSANSTVLDNDVHHFAWSAISSPQTAGVPFSVSVTAQDINSLTISNYVGPAALSGAGDSGAVTVVPTTTGTFSNGVWSGNVAVTNVDDSVHLIADDGAGHTGQSAPFNVVQGVGVLGVASGTNICKTVPGASSAGVSFGNVTAGQTYVYQASGCVALNLDGAFSDPDGKTYTNNCLSFISNPTNASSAFICPGLNTLSLVGKIGSTCIQLGKSGSFIAPSSGTLTLYYNDQIFGDNSGSWDACISVPSDLVSSGPAGGPFSPSSQVYTLTNSGTALLDWSISVSQNWVSLSATSGTLAVGASVNVTGTINANANSLAVGVYSNTVTFTNLTNGNGTTARGITLTVIAPANLAVTPTNELSSAGSQGGPFSPSSQVYTLSNTGSVSLNWSASKSASWVTLSATSGSLAAGSNTTVTVSINANANSLAPGGYSDAVTFTNTTNGAGSTTRNVSLTVNPIGILAVTPSTNLTSSGPTGGPFSPSNQVYALTNSGGAALSWSGSNTTTWVSLSATGGTLAAGAGTNVTVTINTNANSLAVGVYSNTVTFANLSSGTGTTTRVVALTVTLPGVLGVMSGTNICGTVLGAVSGGQSFGTVTAGQTYNYQASGCITWQIDIGGGPQSVHSSVPNGNTYTNTCANFTGGPQAAGSGFICPGLYTTSLVGKIGGASCFQLGSSGTFIPSASGLLTLYFNDDNFFDNSGSWSVCITAPSDLTSSGPVGGPFSPVSQVYTLTNSGGGALNWSGSNTSTWASLSTTGGTLAVGASVNVTVSINSNANSLAAGVYSNAVTFTNLSNGNGTTTRAVILTVMAPANLAVTPANGLSSAGIQGGPFSPSSQGYTLSNSGSVSLNWSASKSASWLTLSATNGSLMAASNTTVTVSINTNANNLMAGNYVDSLTFTNTTNGIGATNRMVSLAVLSPWQQWQLTYFNCTNCPQAAPTADPDGDGQNNQAEFASGTNPTNSASAFCIVEIATLDDDMLLTWTTVGGKKYAVQTVAAGAGGYTNSYIQLAPVIIAPGAGESLLSVIHLGGATNVPARFYRVRLVP